MGTPGNSDGGNAPFARHFFMRTLPAHLSQNIEKFAALAGTIRFSIPGQGAWTLRMGDLEQPVLDGESADADLSLWFEDAAFAAFIQGRLDVADAVVSRKVRFSGDVGLLEKFGFLLAASSNAVSARFNR